MCGIVGWLGEGVSREPEEFEQAIDLLSHRGPDDRGKYFEPGVLLGHRRLAILDLTTAGHQPMIDAETGAVISYNGEVYNYPELREVLEGKGYVFRTQSDTEVVLKAYLEWGSDCLHRFNGMWAFAIWQPTERRLFVARDRFGVKPFYFVCRNGELLFASEPKALLHLVPEACRVDRRTLYRFLAWGELYTSGHSFYESVELLPPAHFGEFEIAKGRFCVRRYWDLPEEPRMATPTAEAVEEFSALLDDAIRVRLRSDVAVGISLSGGLDSTAALAGSMKAGGERRLCFTSVYGAADAGESEWARCASMVYGIRPIEVDAPFEEWITSLRDICWHMDAPGYSPAVYPMWQLVKEARRQKVPVLLEGQGADEALGGYPQYMVIQLLARIAQLAKRPSADGLKRIRRDWIGLHRTFTRRWASLWLARELFPWALDLRRRLLGAMSTLRPEFVSQVEPDSFIRTSEGGERMDAVTQRLWRDHRSGVLPGLLHYGDAVSMAHSVESRLPFMDYRLVEWLFMQSSEIKLRDGETKWVLRQYLHRAGQSAVASRTDKLGYPTPLDQWLAADRMRIPRDLLLDDQARCHEFCDKNRIERLIRMHGKGYSGVGNHIYRLISTELWLQECLHGRKHRLEQNVANT